MAHHSFVLYRKVSWVFFFPLLNHVVECGLGLFNDWDIFDLLNNIMEIDIMLCYSIIVIDTPKVVAPIITKQFRV